MTTNEQPQLPPYTPPGEALTMEEYAAIVADIQEKHGWSCPRMLEPGCKMIKYIRPQIDTRDWRVFRIEFQYLAQEITFDFRDSSEPMYPRILAWLEGD